MSVRTGELEERARIANSNLKAAIRSFAHAENVDIEGVERSRKSISIELGFNEKSSSSVPVAIRRLIKSAYTDHFPIWAIKFGLAYDPTSPHLPHGEYYATTLDIAVHGHEKPTSRELEEGKITVGKRESLLSPVITIEADIHPLKYLVEKTPIILSSRSRPVRGTHLVGDVGPAVIEAGVKILTSHPRIDPDLLAQQLLERANYGRARRAAGMIRDLIYAKVGVPTETPSVRVEQYTPPQLI